MNLGDPSGICLGEFGMHTDPIIDVHLHIWAKEMYGRKYMTAKSEDFFRRFTDGVAVGVD